MGELGDLYDWQEMRESVQVNGLRHLIYDIAIGVGMTVVAGMIVESLIRCRARA
jgi:hypothetical protein